MSKSTTAEWWEENWFTVVFWAVLLGLGLWWLVSTTIPKASPVETVINNGASTICYSAEEAQSHEGESSCVDFTVGYTYETNAGTKFLDQYRNYTEGFVVYIPRGSQASDLDLGQFEGKKVRVHGDIKPYSTYTEIEVTDPTQIEIFN